MLPLWDLNNAKNKQIANWLNRITDNNHGWGYGLCYLYLRNVKNYAWSHKRIYQIYRELELNLRIKHRKHLVRDKPDALVMPPSINQVWSIDFMYDQLQDGRSIWLFNVIDDFNCEAWGIKVSVSLPAERAVRSLDQIIAWCGKPGIILADNEPELVGGRLMEWSAKHQIYITHIQLGKPQ